jgi:hypothetical protein
MPNGNFAVLYRLFVFLFPPTYPAFGQGLF